MNEKIIPTMLPRLLLTMTLILLSVPTLRARRDSLYSQTSEYSEFSERSERSTKLTNEQTNKRTNEQTNWWLNRLKAHDLNLSDTAVIYPKFLKFCVNVYNWGDEFFNGTDHEYVEGTGKRWKVRAVSDNWVDSYIMTLPEKMHINMISDVYSNVGAYIQYMAVSMGYSFDAGKVFQGHPVNHKKWQFGFSCQRFNIELYYNENEGGSNIHKFGHYKNPDGHPLDMKFKGVSMHTQGLKAVYFLNHRKYSNGAAYNFSKFQRRSQGSWIIGYAYTGLKVDFDFTQLPPELLPYMTMPVQNMQVHYDSYALVGGYGYNWVITPRLLYNITMTPAIGASHCYEDSVEGEKWMFSANIGARTSLTYNFGRGNNWFLCFMASLEGSWYKSGTFSVFSSIENFSGNIGLRF